MARNSKKGTLVIWMNGERVGEWSQGSSTQSLQYDPTWITQTNARPLSLSLPFTPNNLPLKGDTVRHYFENLLPDSHAIRERLATRYRANSTDAYDLLYAIGRECIGAVQLLPEGVTPQNVYKIDCEALSHEEVEKVLASVTRTGPLQQRDEDSDFRISIAGAQEKTALLWHKKQWQRPLGATPTTHIFKLPLGLIANVGDLSDSVENEWLCAQILREYGLPIADCEMAQFGEQRVLIVKRFDRQLSVDKKWIIRLPQEDFCQALGVSPLRKYEADGGPGIEAILKILENSNARETDRNNFYSAQILFWMLAATDGHAKNFSLFLGAGGTYRLTPFYDVFSAWPYMAGKGAKLSKKKVKLAMAVRSKNAHYQIDEIQRRHWNEMARRCGLGLNAENLIKELIEKTLGVIKRVSELFPKDFPEHISTPVFEGLLNSSNRLAAMEAS